MVRRYGDPVLVRAAEQVRDDVPAFRPGAFLWRGRVYVVRDILGYWRERRAWWTDAAAAALHGEVDADDEPSGSTLEAEREVWRVEASRGRTFGSGVFDLCREVPAAPEQEWRLLSVSD